MGKIYIVLFFAFISQLGYSQLNGPIPQPNAPKNINEPKKKVVLTPEAEATNQGNKIADIYAFTPKQRQDLIAVLVEYEQKVAQNNKSKLSTKEKYKINQKLSLNKQSKMKAIFTKEQYKQYLLSFP